MRISSSLITERQKSTPSLAFPDEERPTRRGAFKVSSKILKLWRDETGKDMKPDQMLFKRVRAHITRDRGKLAALFGKDSIADAQDVIAKNGRKAFRLYLRNLERVDPKLAKYSRGVPENVPLVFYAVLSAVSGQDMADIVFKRYFETISSHPGALKVKTEDVLDEEALSPDRVAEFGAVLRKELLVGASKKVISDMAAWILGGRKGQIPISFAKAQRALAEKEMSRLTKRYSANLFLSGRGSGIHKPGAGAYMGVSVFGRQKLKFPVLAIREKGKKPRAIGVWIFGWPGGGWMEGHWMWDPDLSSETWLSWGEKKRRGGHVSRKSVSEALTTEGASYYARHVGAALVQSLLGTAAYRLKSELGPMYKAFSSASPKPKGKGVATEIGFKNGAKLVVSGDQRGVSWKVSRDGKTVAQGGNSVSAYHNHDKAASELGAAVKKWGLE
tara:strand:- start:7811 stop:9142 length:1332 start_codon:yes stop_codon:yes gene_type:complete